MPVRNSKDQRERELDKINQKKMAIKTETEVTEDTIIEYVSMQTRDINLIKSYILSLKKSMSSISKELVKHEV